MASFTQNISGVINCFGIQPSTKWGSPMKWGSDKWGNGVTGTFGLPTRAISVNNDTGPTFTDTYSNRFKMGPFVNTAVFMQNGIRESLQDGSGNYFYILSGGVTNDENAVVPNYTKQAKPTSTWNASSTSTVSWVTQ